MIPLNYVLWMGGGVLGGLAYHRFIGCRSGACFIWSSPYLSAAYGALLGYIMASGGR